MQVTNKGFVAERLDEIIDKLCNGFREIYGSDINLDADTPDGQIIGLIAQAKADIEELGAVIYKCLDPDYASGSWLELNAAYAGIRRKTAAYSYLRNVILTGDAGAIIPAGSSVQDEQKKRWVMVNEIILNQEGSARADFRSEELGSYAVPEHTELTPETIVLGWHKAVTSLASELGNAEELDSELRPRFYRSRTRPAQNCVDGIEARIRDLPDVKECICLENYTQETDKNGLPPHSINVIVDGGREEEIAAVIYQNKTAGAAMQGDMIILHQAEQRLSVPIRFDRPTIVNCALSIEVARLEHLSEIDTEAIKQAISNEPFAIGEDIVLSRLYCPINQVSGFSIKSLKIGKTGKTLGTQDIEIDVRSRARFAIQDIEVLVL